MIVYLITNKINGKQYVGQTIQKLEDRWKTHRSSISGCLALKSAIEKYCPDNFTVEVIYEANSMEELNKKEQEFINKLNTLAPNGYNLTTGGERPKYSEESRKKMSQSSKGRSPWNKGLTAKDPRVAKYIRKGKDHHNFGKPSAVKGRKKNLHEIELWRSKVKGQKRTLEQRKANSDGHKKTSIKCNETGKVYNSIMDASRELDINPGHLLNVLNGKGKSAKGFTFTKEVE